MPRIGIKFNNVCNLDYTYCVRSIYRGGQGEVEDGKVLFLSLEILEKIRIEAKPLGYARVAITGGEPPPRPRFGQVIEIIARHGFTYHFLTNARDKWRE